MSGLTGKPFLAIIGHMPTNLQRADLTKSEPTPLAQLDQRVRETIAPRPKLAYPTPWRVAENKGDLVIVVCAEGHYTCEAASMAAAEAIVLAVNTLAGVEA